MGPHDDVHDLISAVVSLQKQCWRNTGEPCADRTLERLRVPLAKVVASVVEGVLSEMRECPADPQTQTVCVHVLRAVVNENKTCQQIVLRSGGVDALVQGLRHHPTNEPLLTGILEAIDEIHGPPALLQAMDHLSESGPGVLATLWAFHKSARVRWPEVQSMSAPEIIRVVMKALAAHSSNDRVLDVGLKLFSDLTLHEPSVRSSFAAAGGWEWLLGSLEQHADSPHVQVSGIRVLSALGKGGSWEEAYAIRFNAVLEGALCRHDQDEDVQHWGLWAVQALNGARALVKPLRSRVFRTPAAVMAALRCLAGAQFGQGDGTSIGDVVDIIDAVVHTMRGFSERFDVLCESSFILGHCAAFLAWELQHAVAGQAAELGTAPLEACRVAIAALLDLLRFRLADQWTVKIVCESITEILEACDETSPLRTQLCRGLFGDADAPGGQTEGLLSKVTSAHVSNDQLQATIMGVMATFQGVSWIVQEMLQHSTSHAVQLPAIRALGAFYGNQLDLDGPAIRALPEALRAVIMAMASFPENLILQQHSCYALFTIAEHFAEPCNGVSGEVLVHCAAAAGQALHLVHGRCDSRDNCASYNALYLRKEATRCIATVCRVQPNLGRWLQERGVHEVLAGALRSTAESMADGKRDIEAEETLCLEVLALSYVLGPEMAVLEPLRRWGATKPAVARAAADTVVELARAAAGNGGHGNGTVSGSHAVPPTPGTCEQLGPAALFHALPASGCSEALLAAMRVHVADEELQGRLRLALGFIGSTAAQAA